MRGDDNNLTDCLCMDFSKVQNFITHFWKGMPGHIISVLECPMVVDIVGICDSILYKVRQLGCDVITKFF